MKPLTIILLSGVLILTACGQTLAYNPSTPQILATETNTLESFTSTPLPTRTPRERANEPTRTPRPLTPLPTIPTFTPTFDAQTIVTVTPAPHAICPKENPEIVAKFATPNSDGSYELYRASDILDYLNSGGTSAQLRDSGIAEIIDLTDDGVNEVVYGGLLRAGVSILGCKDGKYQDFLDFGGDFWVNLIKTPDLNKNGISEVILFNRIHYGYVHISIFEWDGNNFHSLIDMGSYGPSDPPIDWVSFNEGYQVIDTNGDGLKEIVVVYNVHQQAKGVLGGYDIAVQRRSNTRQSILKS